MKDCGQENIQNILGDKYMVDFSKLKKASTSSLEKISQELEKINNREGYVDSKYWRPTVDQAGNGSAIIRFLPLSEKDGEDGLPWVKIWKHNFVGPTGLRYVENSLTTLNQKDPVNLAA